MSIDYALRYEIWKARMKANWQVAKAKAKAAEYQVANLATPDGKAAEWLFSEKTNPKLKDYHDH